jgi:hypothetical protein
MSTGSKNTILGRFTGNQGGLDIRASSNNIVLSDGDGNPRAYCNNNGSWNVNSIVGKTYFVTSTSGGTAITDTGIYNNTAVLGWGTGVSAEAAVYDIYITGNPNGGGSGSYRGVMVGYVIILGGYVGGAVVQEIRYVETATQTGTSNNALTCSVVFWDGTTETTSILSSSTSAQIRIKIAGYNASYTGISQAINLTRRL